MSPALFCSALPLPLVFPPRPIFCSTRGLLSCSADPHWSRVVFSCCWLILVPVGLVFQSCFSPEYTVYVFFFASHISGCSSGYVFGDLIASVFILYFKSDLMHHRRSEMKKLVKRLQITQWHFKGWLPSKALPADCRQAKGTDGTGRWSVIT